LFASTRRVRAAPIVVRVAMARLPRFEPSTHLRTRRPRGYRGRDERNWWSDRDRGVHCSGIWRAGSRWRSLGAQWCAAQHLRCARELDATDVQDAWKCRFRRVHGAALRRYCAGTPALVRVVSAGGGGDFEGNGDGDLRVQPHGHFVLAGGLDMATKVNRTPVQRGTTGRADGVDDVGRGD
jgi:hypothetical protein